MVPVAVSVFLLGVAGAIVAAYFCWLALRRRPAQTTAAASGLPPVTIIVPVHDEAPVIERKLANLSALRYPPEHLTVLLVDGGSTDGTIPRLVDWTRTRARTRLLRTSCRDKTAQINLAVAEADTPWILLTDADALLAPDTLEQAVAAVIRNPHLGVVGVPVRPHAGHPLERLHWRVADWLRAREHDCGSASIVTAPCYFARRELLVNMPADTVADDVHVACRAMGAGLAVGVVQTCAIELRSPRTFGALLRHKFRKADAYLREIVRFLPGAARLRPPMRSVFLWRAALMMICPPLALLAAGHLAWAAASLLVLDAQRLQNALLICAPVPLLLRNRAARTLGSLALLGVVLVGVSALAVLLYPLSGQTARLPKVLRPSEYRLSEVE
jgi:hypothetical protein